MKFDKKEAMRCMIEAKSNTSIAIVMYIAKNGCSSAAIKCKKCPIQLVCDHVATNAQMYAIRTMAAVEKRIEEIKKQ